ncbi:MAG: hypothetical protein CEN90_470 [Parcubacteria group bacterium Licking1014_17]|nr:MAG: hypothetical protein CEN90_470 [Parcubacteria group bacterium Licking1014_17]
MKREYPVCHCVISSNSGVGSRSADDIIAGLIGGKHHILNVRISDTAFSECKRRRSWSYMVRGYYSDNSRRAVAGITTGLTIAIGRCNFVPDQSRSAKSESVRI